MSEEQWEAILDEAYRQWREWERRGVRPTEIRKENGIDYWAAKAGHERGLAAGRAEHAKVVENQRNSIETLFARIAALEGALREMIDGAEMLGLAFDPHTLRHARAALQGAEPATQEDQP
jgi:hypothetical protein